MKTDLATDNFAI